MPDPTPANKFPLDRHALDAIDKKLLQLELSYPSITDQELADEVGLGRDTVNHRRNAPKYQRAISDFLAEPIETIRAAMQKAARVLVKGLDSPDEKIRLMAAVKILVSEGIIKDRPDGSEAAKEPIIIRLPIAGEVITVKPN